MTDFNKPLFFNKNRVRRIYTGGAQFAEFCGDDSKEGYYPEEWVCSSVRALNEGSTDEKEGISQLTTGEYFDDLLKNHSPELLGPNQKELGVLVKLLDSSIRLPLQVHPDKAFSRKYFSCEYGKTESWIILGTGKDACIYFGFSENVTKEQLMAAFDADEETLLKLVNKIDVKVGDVFLIRGKAVHAIGKNCLLLEVQEPTDFTIQPENTCGEYVLSDREKYLGLTPEEAFDCFDLELVGLEKTLASATCKKIVEENREKLISFSDTPCFEVVRYNLNNTPVSLNGPSIYVVTDGEAEICWGNNCKTVKQGEYFFVPYLMDKKITVASKIKATVIECVPPIANKN